MLLPIVISTILNQIKILLKLKYTPNLIAPWILIVEWPHMFYEIECNQLIHIKLEATGNYSRKISLTCFKQ